MFIIEVLQSFFVSILVAYLSFTNTLAVHIEHVLAESIEQSTSVPSENTPATLTQEPSEELTLLSRLYATTDSVSRVLFENEKFQAAAQSLRGTASVIAPTLDVETLYRTIEDSLVNILCEYKTDSYTRTTTGTGFFINDNGVILTNAHVAQFLLLESDESGLENVECVVRSGNPATPHYHAELLFISPTWIVNNAELISSEHPRGTGEYDYALLYISESLDETGLPERYPSLPIHADFLPKSLTGTKAITAGYPAEKLSREGPRAILVPEIAETAIHEMYTFGSNYADIFTITESPVGEQGASGGPVVSTELGVIGLIATKGDTKTEGEHSLRALTLSYIDRTIMEETGYSLLENAGGDLAYRGTVFKEALTPFLARLLSFELDE